MFEGISRHLLNLFCRYMALGPSMCPRCHRLDFSLSIPFLTRTITKCRESTRSYSPQIQNIDLPSTSTFIGMPWKSSSKNTSTIICAPLKIAMECKSHRYSLMDLLTLGAKIRCMDKDYRQVQRQRPPLSQSRRHCASSRCHQARREKSKCLQG